MLRSKKQIEEIIRLKYPTIEKIFKTDREEDFSLTQEGYMFIDDLHIYPTTFKSKARETFSTGNLISMKKIFKSPYFIRGKSVFYFDEILHAEICMHGNIADYLKYLKEVENFTKKN